MRMPVAPITNALTIDVEDYFQVSAFATHIARSDWDTRECRIERNINCILEMLERHETKATFFTLGWIAERFPQLATRRDDHVMWLRPEQVVEIAFDGVQRSTRYPGGFALRFARVLRYREDKLAADADTIDQIRAIATWFEAPDPAP